MALSEGPYRTFSTNAGATVPLYVLPFDDQGRCKAPLTRAHLIDALHAGAFTNAFLFSHGWNNEWSDVVTRYEGFIRGFAATRESHGIATGADYRPVLVGVFWPSISLVLPWERAPQFAGAGAAPSSADADAFADEEDRSLDEIAAALPDASVQRFYELASRKELDAANAEELAALLLPALAPGDEGGAEPIGAADLVAAWRAGAAEVSSSSVGAVEVDEGEEFGVAAPVPGGAPQAASFLGLLDPRHAVRMATVWRMKDRAGTVGATGVHELLRDVLVASQASVHLVGHSYGAKVVLSALAAGALPRPVTSVLLLQPAVSHLCFAVDADGKGHPGGYRAVLDRVRQPILTTFSSRDFPLSRVFHLAVRRKTDLGEQKIAAGPPNRFAALGGYGASGLQTGEHQQANVHPEGEPYPALAIAGVRVVSLDASQHISGHGDVSKAATWWALCEQVRHG